MTFLAGIVQNVLKRERKSNSIWQALATCCMWTVEDRCTFCIPNTKTQTVFVCGMQWANHYQIVKNPENLSIYTLDLSQGPFIVPEAYNS